MKTKSYNFVSGYTNHPVFTVIGFLMTFFGAYGFFARGHMYFLPMLFLGIAALITFEGILINSDKNYVKPYTLLLGFLRIGKKYKLSQYPYISILRKTYRSNRMYGGYIPSGSGRKAYERFELYVLSSKHTRRLFIQDFDNREAAEWKAGEMSHFTGLEVVKYSPRGAARSRR